MTANVIDAIREKEADAHAEREEAFAERNRLNQAFFDGFLACKPGISMPGLHAFSYC